jgi:histidinol dehydrogenase
MTARLTSTDLGFAQAFDALVAQKRGAAPDVAADVSAILLDVRARGDEAVCHYTEKFDRVSLAPVDLRVTEATMNEAIHSIDAETRAALELAASRIEAYHREQLPTSGRRTDEAGVELGGRWTPIDAVGLYVPGGKASYPSSVLMNAIPACVAGVARIVMCVPAPGGNINPLVLAAAKLAGVNEVYCVGGAQAIAALAYGTATIAPVDKIVGPRNAYVAEAKRQVFGHVGIDMIAGPSEILVVADGKNAPALTAMDLLSQAEHDEVAQSILITDDPAFADAVAEKVDHHLETLPSAAVARRSWNDFGAIIKVGDLVADAPELIDRLAPEHLMIATGDPDALFERVRHAGAVFLGRHTPEALGDYVVGSNHVLPTARSARFSSGLTVLEFMKRTSIVRAGEAGLKAIGPAAVRLAEAEGLPAHAASVRMRLDRD